MADEWRISWSGFEVISNIDSYRINSLSVEFLVGSVPTNNVRLNSLSTEVLHDGVWVVQTHRPSWFGFEVLESFIPNARASWFGIETIVSLSGGGDDGNVSIIW